MRERKRNILSIDTYLLPIALMSMSESTTQLHHPALRPTKEFRAFVTDVLENPGSRAPYLMEELLSYTNPEVWSTKDDHTLRRIAEHLGHLSSDRAFQHPVWRLRRMKRPERIAHLTEYFYQMLQEAPKRHLPKIYMEVHLELRSRRKKWFATFAPNPTGSSDLTVTVG
jgi:hypothetical protein